VHHYPHPLNEEEMSRAAKAVVGEHDFTSFAAFDPERGKDDDKPSNVRTIFESKFVTEGEQLVYRVRGDGFLHHMVRNLVGTLLLVGKGTLEAESMREILAAKDRSHASPTAPASGLCLVSVEY